MGRTPDQYKVYIFHGVNKQGKQFKVETAINPDKVKLFDPTGKEMIFKGTAMRAFTSKVY